MVAQLVLEQRQTLENYTIDKMLVEDTLGTIYNMDILIKCVLEKLERLTDRNKDVNSNPMLKEDISDIIQLVIILQQEKSAGYKYVDKLLTQIENNY